MQNVGLTVVGSSNTDLVVRCDRLPKPGETLSGGEFSQFAGGKGANQAVAAARAGAAVTFVGARGRDAYGRAAAESLRAEGIETSAFLEKRDVSSGVALILVGNRGGQNLIAVARSANDSLTASDVRRACRHVPAGDTVVAQLEIPLAAVEEAARSARAAGARFVLNPAPARRLPASLLRAVDVLTPNEHEARLLAGSRDLRRCGRVLRARGCGAVVITLGARGVWIFEESGDRALTPPVRVDAVDTVGAGDCFTAWLAVGLGEGLSLAESATRAMAAAAICVTRPGAQAAMPRRREVLRVLR